MKKEVDFGLYAKTLITALIAVLSGYLFFSMVHFQARTDEKQMQNITDALRKAAVQCYALEGAYPPDIYYLRDHYGIVLDETRYLYFYEVYGANMMPDIEVFLYPEGGAVFQ